MKRPARSRFESIGLSASFGPGRIFFIFNAAISILFLGSCGLLYLSGNEDILLFAFALNHSMSDWEVGLRCLPLLWALSYAILTFFVIINRTFPQNGLWLLIEICLLANIINSVASFAMPANEIEILVLGGEIVVVLGSVHLFWRLFMGPDYLK